MWLVIIRTELYVESHLTKHENIPVREYLTSLMIIVCGRVQRNVNTVLSISPLDTSDNAIY